MQIVRVRLDEGHWQFHVYPAREWPDPGFVDLVHSLRGADLPVVLGGPADDPGRALTIGPLGEERAHVFSSEWMGCGEGHRLWDDDVPRPRAPLRADAF